MKKIIEKQEADLNDERVSLNKILLEKIKKMEVFKLDILYVPYFKVIFNV